MCKCPITCYKGNLLLWAYSLFCPWIWLEPECINNRTQTWPAGKVNAMRNGQVTKWKEPGFPNPYQADCSFQKWKREPMRQKDPHSPFSQFSLGLNSCIIFPSALNIRTTSSTGPKWSIFIYIIPWSHCSYSRGRYEAFILDEEHSLRPPSLTSVALLSTACSWAATGWTELFGE